MSTKKSTLSDSLAPETTGLSSSFPVEMLAQEEGTVPFVGLEHSGSLPSPIIDETSLDTPRLEPSADAFSDVISGLPQAKLADIHIENLFTALENGDVAIRTDEIESLQSIAVDDIEMAVGESFDEIVDEATEHASDLITTTAHRAVVDPRRLLLRTLFDVDCRCHWQIASDQYEPGDMQAVLGKQVEAAPTNEAFGWVRFRDWGGDVKITTIFPSLECSPELDQLPDDIEIDGDSFHVAETATQNEYLDETDQMTIYYGVTISYGFRGKQSLSASPVVYVAEQDMLLPVPDDDEAFTFDRVHRGDFMSRRHERDNDRQSPLEWHTSLLDKLEELSETIETDIIRSILVSLDFSAYEFSVAEFYEYLGIQSTSQAFPTSVAEEAADRVEEICDYSGYTCPTDADCDDEFATFEALQDHHEAEHGFRPSREVLDETHQPYPRPSLWTLQVALKTTIADRYQGSKASDRYQVFAEIAGELLRRPAQQIKIAISEHNYQTSDDDGDSDDDESQLPEGQATLEDALDGVVDIDGVERGSVGLSDAQQVQREVQQELSDLAEE